MAGPQIVPEAEQIKKQKAEAKEHFEAIKGAAVMSSTSSLKIGFHAYWLKKNNQFGVLGFADENEAREAAGVGASTWFANIRLAEAFQGVPEERFCKMKQANATALADLPDSKRLSTTWLRMAETMKIKEFAEKVDEEMHGKARPSDGKEGTASMKFTMPTSRKRVIEEKVKEFATTHGLDAADTGKVFEVMAVEATEGATLIGSITTALQRVKKVKEYGKSGLSADEVLVKVMEELDGMVLDFQKALSQKERQKEAA